MKKINLFLVLGAVLALLMTGCSKDGSSPIEEPFSEAQYVDLSFGALLNDLSNRAMATTSKSHFDQVPTCSDAEPAIARIAFSYGGNSYETDVAILKDESGYFTDYTEDLKIPVANGGTTIVTLEEFMVYDGDPDGGGELIWIAPISLEEGEFDGYVDNPLPFDIEVQDGTKPYIEVEVLCFDRRMVNEYGYVFFDLDNAELIEFCIFGNFCPPSGRHYVAAYSVDVWTVNEEGNNIDQLYDDLTRQVSDDNGVFSADPLCIVLPDDLDETDRYRIEITILDGPNYDATEEVIRTTVLTDLEVRTFFDGDDNLEYYHFFDGCGEDDNPPIFDDPRDDEMTYKTCLKSLNDSEALGLAVVKRTGNSLDVTVLATGMEDGMQHFQHIHGAVMGESDATCDNYGSPILPLNLEGGAFPETDGMGNYIYSRSFELDNTQLTSLIPLDNNVVILHGVTGNPGLPVACGELEEVNP